ncbi:LrgB family protein [Alkalicoccus luteus]|uniref:LrgB family protein n=1 Tax=Alkalicoccus luteus TaxID=1237094 RepID=A0A969TY31_9BACI|nr:LrgB family protein [Alkalicoccus luteus]
MSYLLLFLTIMFFTIAVRAYKKWPKIYLNPVVVSTALVLAAAALFGASANDYSLTLSAAAFMLGPATTALAVPVYQHRVKIRQVIWPMVASITAGTAAALILTLTVAVFVQAGSVLTATFAARTVTVPIALELVALYGGDPELVILHVMFTGIIGAAAGPALLTKLRVTSLYARGTAVGAVAHGIGTAQMVQESSEEGASSAVAMALAGIVLSCMLALMPGLL